MKIYDTHSDIMSNLYEKNLEGKTNVFSDVHLPSLTKGEVIGGIWVVYSASDFNVIDAYQIALKEYKNFQCGFDVVFGLEGLRNVRTLEELDTLYQMGIRHASLTWNEENHLATGVAGNTDRGLTQLGKQFLDYMFMKKMFIDVSHLNIKSFYEVIEYNPHNIIASHSNAYTLCPHRRNLNDDQLRVLKEIKAPIGVVTARNFVSTEVDQQNVEGLINHVIYLCDKVGIDQVMLGLDMMDYLGSYASNNANLDDLSSHSDAQNIILCCRKRGFSEQDIEKITSQNYLRVRKQYLGY